MMDEPERLEPLVNAEPPAPLEPVAPPERVPFWGYADLVIFAGLAIPCMLLGFGVVKLALWMLRLHPSVRTWELLAEQFVGYGFLFAALAVMFRLQYDRPFWRSLGWISPRISFLSIVCYGVLLVMSLGVLGRLIHIPTVENPLTKLFKDPTSVILIAIFGSIIAPVCEELLFRGFLQPLLVRSLGAIAGVLATALPFGMLHYQEYGNSWRHVLLISLSGVAFGWMRQATGSTKAAAGLHASFNGFQFVALIAAKGLGPY
jgi:uncharacterized protein